MCASRPSLATLLLLAILTLPAAVPPALAVEKKADPNKEQVRRLQQAQRKLEQEKNELAEQKAAALAQLDEQRQKTDAEAQRSSALKRELGGLRAARDTLAAKLAESEGELRRTLEAGRLADAENKRVQASLSAALASAQQNHAACVERSDELRKLGGEVLERYEKKSCFESSLQSEPFTGLKRVEIENAVEDLRDRLDATRSGS